MYDDHKLYIHPVNTSQRLHAKQFQKKVEGVYNGTRLRQIEANSPVVHRDYRHGIMVEPPGGSPYIVYGQYDKIQNLAESIKDDPDKVMSRVRPLGQSETNEFYLGQQAPQQRTVELTEQEMERSVTARKMFPTMGEDNRPYDRMQEETRALKEHLNEQGITPTPTPSSIITGE